MSRSCSAASAPALALVIVAGYAGGLLNACGGETLKPIPRITSDPSFICEGDEPQRVELDASDSRLADGTLGEGLNYAWHVSPEPVEILRGDTTTASILGLYPARKPIRARLVITDPGGETAEALETVGLTRTTRIPCTEGCESHEICVTIAGDPFCVQDEICINDADCGDCLVCLEDGGGKKRCVEPYLGP